MENSISFLDMGCIYEFRIAAKNRVDYGQAAVDTIRTPDGSESTASL